jgi:hypothetical protein
MRKYIILPLIGCTIALALFAIPARAQNAQGKIEGQIANGTKDAKPTSVQNITVRLFGMSAGATQPFTTTVQTDPNGKFSFSNLNSDSTTKYVLTTQYSGVDYFSDALAFDGIKPTLPATMTVYETTTDRSVLKINQTHLIVDIRQGTFNVIQIVVVQNTADRALVRGANNATLSLPILSGAQNIQFDQPDADQSVIRGDGMMTYTLPFMPGNDQIVYSYAIPFTPPSYQLNLKMPYDSAIVRLLVADVGETIAGAQFTSQSPFQAQNGQKFILNLAQNVKAGTVLNAAFSNLSAAAVSSPSPLNTSAVTRPANQNEPLIASVIVAIAAVLSVVLLAYPILRRRGTSFN